MNKKQTISTYRRQNTTPLIHACLRYLRSERRIPGPTPQGVVTKHSSGEYVDRMTQAMTGAWDVVDSESGRWPPTKHTAENALERIHFWSGPSGAALLHDAGCIDLGAPASAFSPLES